MYKANPSPPVSSLSHSLAGLWATPKHVCADTTNTRLNPMIITSTLLLETLPLLSGDLTPLVFLPLHWLLLPSVLHSLFLIIPSARDGTTQGSVLITSVYTLSMIFYPSI